MVVGDPPPSSHREMQAPHGYHPPAASSRCHLRACWHHGGIVCTIAVCGVLPHVQLLRWDTVGGHSSHSCMGQLSSQSQVCDVAVQPQASLGVCSQCQRMETVLITRYMCGECACVATAMRCLGACRGLSMRGSLCADGRRGCVWHVATATAAPACLDLDHAAAGEAPVSHDSPPLSLPCIVLKWHGPGQDVYAAAGIMDDSFSHCPAPASLDIRLHP